MKYTYTYTCVHMYIFWVEYILDKICWYIFIYGCFIDRGRLCYFIQFSFNKILQLDSMTAKDFTYIRKAREIIIIN